MDTQLNRRNFLKTCGYCALFAASTEMLYQLNPPPQAYARNIEMKKGFIREKLSPYFTPMAEKRIRCDLCPHQCEVENGDRGLCNVRENREGKYYSLVYGNPCAIHADPIEKKPFFHVLPATLSFSVATAGCNFSCKFCQNWEISQARPDETYNYDLPPEEIVAYALKYKCQSVASTYVEPTIFFEYMTDIGRLARKQGILNVMHSNGYINTEPLRVLCDHLDAACIDLKGFTEAYYRNMSNGTLKPVLETLKYLKERGIHTEIVNLMVPTQNDRTDEVRAMCRWIKQELGSGVPLHFTRFHPMYKLKSLPPTPVGTLEQARKIAQEEGLWFVYIGNVPGHDGENTFCPRCKKQIIARRGYHIQSVHLKSGACEYCNEPIPGIWKNPLSSD